jgi:DNA-binding PadR family transcriptional regulator
LFSPRCSQLPESFLPLSSASQYILLALASEERHGYAIMQEVKKASGGTVSLGPGTLYRSIHELLQGGLIEEAISRPVRNEDQRRRYYRLTSLGRKVLACESRRLAAMVSLAKSRKVWEKLPT